MTDTKQQQAATSEMVERVARALSECDGPHWESNALSDETREEYRARARAAIVAMREPTEEMIYSPHVRSALVGVWSAMIDAALSGSSVGPHSSSVAPVLSSAAVSDAANENRRPERNSEG